MDILSNLKYAKGSRKNRKRIGRGEGSGHGGTATKGMNGQLSRSGANKRFWFEGGQMPLQRRVPKRGFVNIFGKEIAIVNIAALENTFEDGAVVDVAALIKTGLVKKSLDGVKILGNGDITKKLTVQVNAFSDTAKQKIEAAGGKAEVI